MIGARRRRGAARPRARRAWRAVARGSSRRARGRARPPATVVAGAHRALPANDARTRRRSPATRVTRRRRFGDASSRGPRGSRATRHRDARLSPDGRASACRVPTPLVLASLALALRGRPGARRCRAAPRRDRLALAARTAPVVGAFDFDRARRSRRPRRGVDSRRAPGPSCAPPCAGRVTFAGRAAAARAGRHAALRRAGRDRVRPRRGSRCARGAARRRRRRGSALLGARGRAAPRRAPRRARAAATVDPLRAARRRPPAPPPRSAPRRVPLRRRSRRPAPRRRRPRRRAPALAARQRAAAGAPRRSAARGLGAALARRPGAGSARAPPPAASRRRAGDGRRRRPRRAAARLTPRSVRGRMARSHAFYVTTPIYYVNAAPHLGHAYTTIAADVLARHHRQRGRGRLLPDRHRRARRAGRARRRARGRRRPQELADRNAERFKALRPRLGATNDFFIRTSDPRARREGAGGPRSASTTTATSTRARTRAGTARAARTSRPSARSPRATPARSTRSRSTREHEDNWFFRLSAFQEPLERAVRRAARLRPAARRATTRRCRSSRAGCRTSRSARAQLDWGVPVPWDPEQVFYVWFDALLNYYTALSLRARGRGPDRARSGRRATT